MAFGANLLWYNKGCLLLDLKLLKQDYMLEQLSSIDPLDALAKLSARCASCQACPLYQGRTRLVFAAGNPMAKIMIVGEGPGYNEDQTGLPFVGRAGQLLDKMLAAIGLERQRDVYIANVVKCRPPENRAPTADEMSACFPYLQEQIQIVQPQIMILMGATALKGVLKQRLSITRSRGQWLQWQDIWVMPMFHPAYLLRNASREKGSPKYLAWQDLKAVKNKYLTLRGVD